MVASLPMTAGGLVGGKTLDDAISGKHATILGKVPAYHEGTHGSVLLSKDVRLVREVRLVFAAVHKDVAGVPTMVTVTLVHGVSPSPAAAKTWGSRQRG